MSEPLIKKNAIPRLIDWSEVRSDALFTLVAMATSILLTLAFNKPLSDSWKRAFRSTSFIFHGQINADMFFIGSVNVYYIYNLNDSEFVFRIQHNLSDTSSSLARTFLIKQFAICIYHYNGCN